MPKGELRLDEAARDAHSGDKWFAAYLPDAVAMPRSVRSVAAILKFASRHRIPVTARGAGCGYVGDTIGNSMAVAYWFGAYSNRRSPVYG